MAEHSICLATPEVRAMSDGRKTQIRRVIKPQPPEWINEFGYSFFTPKGYISGRGDRLIKKFSGVITPAEKFIKCPFGGPGDTLWVKETWYEDRIPELKYEHGVVHYKADDKLVNASFKGLWRSPVTMPRWASRFKLYVVNVRVERVQDIKPAECISEGVYTIQLNYGPAEGPYAIAMFANFWDSINKKDYSWEDNPWVWVASFEVIK